MKTYPPLKVEDLWESGTLPKGCTPNFLHPYAQLTQFQRASVGQLIRNGYSEEEIIAKVRDYKKSIKP